jgi:hypothetical protein
LALSFLQQLDLSFLLAKLSFQSGNIASISHHCLFGRSDLGFDFLFGKATDFVFEDGGDVGHEGSFAGVENLGILHPVSMGSQGGTALAKPRHATAKWWQFKSRCPESYGGDAMNAEIVRINLRYDRGDLKSLLRFAKAHDVELDGRYDIRRPPRLNIWTHTWINLGCRAESSLMFSLEFDWNMASLMSVLLQPGYSWEIFLDELASLETAALGDVVYGRSRCEPKT